MESRHPVTFDDVALVEPEMARGGALVGLQAHGGAGGLQRARGGVGVAGAHPARVRYDVASVAGALICQH